MRERFSASTRPFGDGEPMVKETRRAAVDIADMAAVSPPKFVESVARRRDHYKVWPTHGANRDGDACAALLHWDSGEKS